MLNRYHQTWTASKLVDEIKGGHVNFDHALQRGFVWEKDTPRKSLLIHSLIEDYPIPPMFFSQKGQTRQMDGLDGKQRSNTIKTFMEDGWKLDADFVCKNGEGKKHNFSNKLFSELPDWARERIKNYTFQINMIQNLTEEQLHEMFYRLNNGKPLTGIELMRARAQALTKFQQIARHDFITSTTSAHGKKLFMDEMLVMQIWAAIYALDADSTLSFQTRIFRPFICKATVSDEQAKGLCQVLTIVENIYSSLSTASKREKRMQTKLKTRIHLVTLCRCIHEALDCACTITEIADWTKAFFITPDGTPSVCKVYNASAGGGANNTAIRKNIDKRYNAMREHMEAHIAKQSEEEKRTKETEAKKLANGKAKFADITPDLTPKTEPEPATATAASTKQKTAKK